MPRVFASLAVANLLLLVGAGLLGFFDPADRPDRHVLLAVLSLILACLVQVLTFTYLTVTSKVLVQAIHFGNLSAEVHDEAREIKKRFTRCIGSLVLLIVLVVATGAAAWRSENPHLYHFPAACLFVAGWVWVQVREFDLVSRNAQLLDKTLALYASGGPPQAHASNLQRHLPPSEA